MQRLATVISDTKRCSLMANDVYHWYALSARVDMTEKGIAKIFMHGRSQAVRLPVAFRLPGDRVRVRRLKGGILLEPITTDVNAWFIELDRFGDEPFMPERSREPALLPAPEDRFE